MYEAVKVLEFAKRVYKVLYDLESEAGDTGILLASVTDTPLEEVRNIDILPAETENLSKLSKNIEKIKTKLKIKTNSSNLRKRGSANVIEQQLPPSQKIL